MITIKLRECLKNARNTIENTALDIAHSIMICTMIHVHTIDVIVHVYPILRVNYLHTLNTCATIFIYYYNTLTVFRLKIDKTS